MPSIPQSLLWISLVVLWLFVLVPMLISKRDAVRRTSDVALATRVLNRSRSARLLRRRGPATGHRSDPDWRPSDDDLDDGLEKEPDDEPAEQSVVRAAAVDIETDTEPDYLDVDIVEEDSGALPIGVSASEAGGEPVDEFAELAGRLSDAAGVTAIEVNISCPNVEHRGQVFACYPGAAAAVIDAVRGRARYDIPVFAKLSPDVTDIVEIARACVAAGADGLSLINTMLGMAIDVDTMRPVLAAATGGLSGPAIRPVAVRCIWQVREALPDVPIIGMGGVRTGRDALELILAGASLVSVGTTIFHDPSACIRIVRELEEELARRGIERLSDAVGLAHEPRGAARRRLTGNVL